MEYDKWRSLPGMFFELARQCGDRPFLWGRKQKSYKAINWSDAADQVMALARGLATLGVDRGDRVAVVSENRPEWVLADLAIMSVGAVTVPAYITNTVEDHRHILSNTGARAVIVSTAALARRILAAASEVPSVTFVIALDPGAAQTGLLPVRLWDELLTLEGPNEIEARVAALDPDDIACLIHTSGTSSAPKAVMQTHRNIIANCRSAYLLLQSLRLKDERFLSFLPLSHSYEHTAGLMFPISLGAEIYFAGGAETLAHDLLDVRPTLMTAVPRLYEALHQRIRLSISHEHKIKRLLFERTVAIGRKRLEGERLTIVERLLDSALDKLVRTQVQARFGGRLKAIISGGAPLNTQIGSFFVALGIELLQGYGQSEAAPIICCNRPGHIKIDTVGPPIDGVRVRIAEDGEVLVAGDNVMRGYWNEPAETMRTILNGWLHTGDIGMLDEDGYLRITDRKRDFIKNSGGDMISPLRVEGALTLASEIAQAIVFGDQRPYLVAVLVPDHDFVATYAKESGLLTNLALLAHDRDFHRKLREIVSGVNQGLSIAERIRHFIIATEPFTVDNGQLTPTLKIRRHVIREVYRPMIDALYDGKENAA